MKNIKRLKSIISLCVPVLLCACASAPYEYGTGRMELDEGKSPKMEKQVLIGKPHKFLDASDWFWPESLLSKLLLWDKNIDSHQISTETISQLEQYISDNKLDNVQILVNSYSPGNQWRRLFQNKTVGAGWRYTLGIISVSMYTILPGRFFGGDAYNPFSNTIYLYSDIPAIALHEAGHAKDFGRRENKGMHAALYMLPFVALYYEAMASNDALSYLEEKNDPQGQKDAYRILHPAYSTYVGGNLTRNSQYAGLGFLAVIPGHISGWIAASKVKED